jgi:hypothetical protein
MDVIKIIDGDDVALFYYLNSTETSADFFLTTKQKSWNKNKK